jgi:hypothetical protein
LVGSWPFALSFSLWRLLCAALDGLMHSRHLVPSCNFCCVPSQLPLPRTLSLSLALLCSPTPCTHTPFPCLLFVSPCPLSLLVAPAHPHTRPLSHTLSPFLPCPHCAASCMACKQTLVLLAVTFWQDEHSRATPCNSLRRPVLSSPVSELTPARAVSTHAVHSAA